MSVEHCSVEHTFFILNLYVYSSENYKIMDFLLLLMDSMEGYLKLHIPLIVLCVLHLKWFNIYMELFSQVFISL